MKRSREVLTTEESQGLQELRSSMDQLGDPALFIHVYFYLVGKQTKNTDELPQVADLPVIMKAFVEAFLAGKLSHELIEELIEKNGLVDFLSKE